MHIRDIVRSVFMSGSACIVGAIVLLMPTAASAALKYEPSNYAARGNLLLQLDGIRNTGLLKAHDSSSKTWFDLAKTNGVYFGNATGSGITSEWAEDGYKFGGGEFGRLAHKINPGNAFTIQVVFDADKSAQSSSYPHYLGVDGDKCNLYTYKDTGNNQMIFRVKAVSGISDASIQSWTGAQRYITALYDKGKSSAFSTETGAVTAGTTTMSVGEQWFNIGGVYNSSATERAKRYLNGKIKAVRIYNKVLSAAELTLNRALDNARFFDGIPVTNVVVATAVEGLEGNEGSGNYAFDDDGYTFTAPQRATKDGVNYVCTGYTLEKWNGTAWGAPVRFAATSCTLADTSAKVRLTWQWQALQNTADALTADLDPFFNRYVSDHLVLHLDGIRNVGANAAHDDRATTWVDLVCGKTATFYHDEADGSCWTGDGYWFDGRSYAKLAEQLTGLGKQVTVQVVCEADPTVLYAKRVAQTPIITWPMLIGCNDNDTLNLYYDVNGDTAPNHMMTFKCVTTDNNAQVPKGTWNGRYVTAIRDGTDKYIFDSTAIADATGNAHRTGTKNDDIPDATVYIGAVGSTLSLRQQRWFYGKIMSVRVYDKVLSNTELEQNRVVDEARFFGGPIPVTNVVVASAVRSIGGNEPDGAYAFTSSGHTFTAPASVTVGDDTYSCAGYTLETWDDETGAWGEAVLHSGETSCALTDTSAKVRLAWKWNHTDGPGYDLAFNDYVTDGLVVHLDGIRNTGVQPVHDSAATTWADLSAGGDWANFVLNGGDNGWASDGYRFDGRSKVNYAVMNTTRMIGNTYTAQAVVDFDRNTSHRIVTPWPSIMGATAETGDPFTMYYNQNNTASPGVNFKVANTQMRTGGVQSWRGEYMTGWSDGSIGALFQGVTADASAAFNKSIGTQTFTFAGGNGGNYADRRFNGTYKAARIYNRALSDAELEKNRAADEVRFFGRSPAATGDLVVASAVEGLSGDQPNGAYRPAVGYTFTSQTEAVLDGVPYELKGYTLETWNGTEWSAANVHDGENTVTPDVSTASKRLTWNWAVKSRLTKIQDSFDVGDYVQDDLYLFFDGIRNAGANVDHAPDATTWVNLGTGGASLNATFDSATGSNSGGWADDGYNFVYGGKFATLGANPDFNNRCYLTIQVVCEAEPSTAIYPTLFGSTGDYLNIYTFQSMDQLFTKIFNNRGQVKEGDTVTTAAGGRKEMSGTWEKKYANLIWHAGAYTLFQTATPAFDSWSGRWRYNWDKFHDQPFYIGGVYFPESSPESATNTDQRRFNGKIQAIRVYNRSLSDEELEQNRKVDEARFKGNPPESNVIIATKYGDGTGEVLAEGTGHYKVEGTYTFSATSVKDANGVLGGVAGFYLETYVDGVRTGKTWHDGNSFAYTEDMGNVRIVWSTRPGGIVLILK